MENMVQIEYRENMLEWCNNIFQYWESMKPRFSNLFDMKSLDEWEESFRNLKEKLESDFIVSDEDYDNAKSLFDHCELLFNEIASHRTNNQFGEVNIETTSDREIDEPNEDIDNITIQLKIPREEFRKLIEVYKF